MYCMSHLGSCEQDMLFPPGLVSPFLLPVNTGAALRPKLLLSLESRCLGSLFSVIPS